MVVKLTNWKAVGCVFFLPVENVGNKLKVQRNVFGLYRSVTSILIRCKTLDGNENVKRRYLNGPMSERDVGMINPESSSEAVT